LRQVILYGKEIKLKLSGNEVYHTYSLILLVRIFLFNSLFM
jgi:hypothetical protein